MKKSTLPLVLGLCATGFLSGFAGKRLVSGAPVSASDAPKKQNAGERATATGSSEETPGPLTRRSRNIPARTSNLRSTDTLESLDTLEGDALFARLALWMLDASEEDIAAYWTTARDKPNRPNEITDLIFISWTRRNPQAAIAAVAGTGSEHYAWWAWACHDPQNSLATALATNPGRVNNVTWGIGEFHADWLMENFDKIPESGRDNALRGLVKWDDTDQPLEILEFLKKNGNQFNQRIFATLIRKDPWAAYDWIQKNQSTIASQYGSADSAMNLLVKTMGESQPEALQRLADQTPSGDAKWKMEAVLFENLLKTDPAAALKQAESTKAPRIAAERFAALGLGVARTDPEKAYELTKKLFAIYPDALSAMTRVQYPNGSSGSGSSIKGVQELVGGLMDKDPARVLEMIPPPTEGGNPESRSFSKLADLWAERDLVAYTNWVNQQTDPAIRTQAAAVVVNQLTQQQQFQEATEWAMSSDKTKSRVGNIIYQWSRSDPAAAKDWVESADLPEDQKDNIRRTIKAFESHNN